METRKLIASTVAVVTLGAGGLAVAAVNPFTGAGAEEQPPTGAPKGPDGRRGHGRGHGRGEVLSTTLDELVAKGTITRAQADAVLAAVEDKAADHPGRGRGRGRGHDRRPDRRQAVVVAAKAIGIDAKELATALRDGKSIADVARANGVDPTKVVDALVKAGTARVDAAVVAGRLKPEKAAKIKQRLPEMAKRIVEHHRD